MRKLVAAAGVLLSMLAGPAFSQGPAPVAPAPAAVAVPQPAGPAVVAPVGPAEMTAQDVTAFLDGFVPIAMARGGIAGTVVVVVKDGQVLVKKGYGFADLAKRTPVDPDRTLFRPGSISKLFTWTAVMQQVEAGKIDLDADVNRYLDFEVPPFEGKPLTMRNLMTHTPGFEESVRGLITSDPKNGDLEATLKRWVPTRVFAPGTTPAYSNYATGLAGYIMQRVSGLSFDDYIDQRVTGPLGMADSSFRQPLPPRLQAQMSSGYTDIKKPAQPFEIVNMPPAGSLSSSGADMAKFMIAHLQQGQLNGAQILSPATAKQMHDTRLDIMAPLNGMRLGFYAQDINGRRVITHGGDTQQFHSLLSLFIDDNVGLYQSVNSTGVPNGNFRQALFEAFADRYFPATAALAPSLDDKTAADYGRQIAGSYTMARGSFSNFVAVGGLVSQLKVVLNPDNTVSIPLLTDPAGIPKRYRAVAPWLWQEVGGHDRLGAKLVDGKIEFISVDMLSPIIVMKPVPAHRDATWLLPAAGAGLAAIVLTVVLWPVIAIVRKRYGQRFALTGQRAKAYRAVRVGGILVLLALAAWGWIVSTFMGENGMNRMMAMDGQLQAVQAFAAFALVGGLALSLWNLWAVFKGPSGWFGKLWSVVLVLAFGILFYFALLGRLMHITTYY